MVMLTDRAAFGRERTSMTHPKRRRLLALGAAAGILALAAIWLWGWRLFGFRLCADPQAVFVRSILVDDDEVAISGEGDYQNLHYHGYTYRIDGDVLIVGVRYLRYIPISQTDRFFLCIPVDTPIRSIVVSNGWSEKTVYSA